MFRQVKIHLKHAGYLFFFYRNIMWMLYLKHFSHLFALDSVLPYTFLALLNESQLVDMLNASNGSNVAYLPIDGTFACALHHLPKGSEVSCHLLQEYCILIVKHVGV